jgi:ubiquinone biosynthesis protein COQ4
MSKTPAAFEYELLGIPPAPPRKRAELRRAWTVLRELVADPTRTEKVFELFQALGGDDGEGWFRAFLEHPEGRRLMASRRCLAEKLSDRAALAALPAGSLGRAYLAHLERWGLDPMGVIDAQRRHRARNGGQPDPLREWYFDRLELIHDLWHTLTGYGADEAGEAAVLAFSHGQMPQRAMAVLVLTAAVIGPKEPRLRWQRYLLRAWRRGRRAARLDLVAWEDLLAQPLDDVRAAFRVEPPERAHPDGVIEGGLFRTRGPAAVPHDAAA